MASNEGIEHNVEIVTGTLADIKDIVALAVTIDDFEYVKCKILFDSYICRKPNRRIHWTANY